MTQNSTDGTIDRALWPFLVRGWRIALSLWFLPRLKGGIVAFQWARRQSGFDEG